MRLRQSRWIVGWLGALGWFAAGLPGCDSPRSPATQGAGAAESTDSGSAAVAVVRPDTAQPMAPDRMTARHVITFYRWVSTEAPTPTNPDPTEHGMPKLHFVVEVHRNPQGEGWVTLAALAGTTSIPENRRFQSTSPAGNEWHVPPGGITEYQVEQFGGDVRGNEPIRAFLASALNDRVTLPISATPQPIRLPATATWPVGPRSVLGQFDAIVVILVPVTGRRGGRYLVYALDMLAQPGGFSANGIMDHVPSTDEIMRYTRWMRDRNGMNRDRNPPIAMQPIDRG